MTVPRDVLRFEILLYLSLLVDSLSVAFFGVAPGESEPAEPVVNLLTAAFIGLNVLLVWLAARRRKNWARLTLLGFFTLAVAISVGFFSQTEFGLRTVIDMLSLALSAVAFYFAFTTEARQWFGPPGT
jgi:hypothetical protein